MADFAVTKLGAKRVAVFFQNDQFGKDQRDGAAEYLKSKGSQPAGEASYVPSDVDISAQVIALRQADPDAVILGVIPKHGALFVKETQRLGWKAKVVGHNTGGRSGGLGPGWSGGAGRRLRQPHDCRRQHGQARR